MEGMGDDIRETVRRRYAEVAEAARRAAADASGGAAGAGCCAGASCCGGPAAPPAAGGPGPLHDGDDVQTLPAGARLASLGCGDPVAFADLRPGEVVLDLGCGGGSDVLLAARRVAPDGMAIGLDITDGMLALAEENRRRAGVGNARFVKGDMAAIPLPDGAVDVVLSNCVVNLAPDKDAVLREVFRVLRPGGRLAVADVVVTGPGGALPPEVRADAEAWAACVGGAMGEDEYRRRLQAAGFTDVSIDVLHEYDPATAGSCCAVDLPPLPAGVRLVSALVRARRPRQGRERRRQG